MFKPLTKARRIKVTADIREIMQQLENIERVLRGRGMLAPHELGLAVGKQVYIARYHVGAGLDRLTAAIECLWTSNVDR